MSTLAERLEAAKAEVSRLEQAAKTATCVEIGAHNWKMIGGVNCQAAGGCGDCSVAVNECTRCGACDYGEGREAERQVEQCRCADEAKP